MSLLLTKSEQGTVVFHIWKNLKYSNRLLLSFIFIVAGIFFQYYTINILPGIILVLAGNLLLLVKGYDNRIKLGTFEHETEWATIDLEHLEKVVKLNNKMTRWDISALDITNVLGGFLFVVILIVLFVLVFLNPFHSYDGLFIVVANIVVLIIPHWLTGTKRVTTAPALVNKIELYQGLLKAFKEQLMDESVSFLMLLKGKDKKMPTDVKMKVKLKNQPEDFLGLYAQVSVNNVKGQDYPYFYVVLVAKESSGLISKKAKGMEMPRKIISEFEVQDGAEILVIRQFTTKNSGYHTKESAIHLIFETGLNIAGKILEV